jgi:alpha-tubulin suppressor-like RCC1 family protein
MTKKPIDEDRIRRKELLEQKKAARKAAAALAEAAEKAKLEKKENELQLQHESNNHHDNNNNTTTIISTTNTNTVSLLSLPVDALQIIYTMLSVTDIYKFIVLSYNQQCYVTFLSSYKTYLLSRLYNTTTANNNSNSYNSMTVQLCKNENDIQQLLVDVLDDDNEIVSSITINKKQNNKNNTNNLLLLVQQIQSRLYYTRFIEEAVLGYSMIHIVQLQQLQQYIQISKFVQGRICSISPEHSIVRMGGSGTNTTKNKNNMNGSSTCSSSIVSWGIGRRGQLGHNSRNDERYPKRILQYGNNLNNFKIVQVSAGGGLVRVAHTLFLTNTGKVLSFGTGQYGALGHGYSAAKQLPDYLKPTYITALQSLTCICVAAGELHSACVTSDGDVYTWGDGFCGQLGHGDKRPITLPKQVMTGDIDTECVINISCGSRHTLSITEDGECYSWGLGHFGVLGRSYTPFEYDADTAVHHLASFNHDNNSNIIVNNINGNTEIDHAMEHLSIQEPDNGTNLIQEPIQEQQPRVRDTAAELAAHLDLIANLTLDDSSDQCIAKVIDTLQGIKLVTASAGHRHSLLLDENGYLYSFGAGSSGCLGHGNTESCMYPCRINALNDDDITDIHFRQMSAGVDISMAVSTIGNVYAWGKTEGGRIGLGMAKSQINVPRRVYLNDTTKQTTADSAKKSSKIGQEFRNEENDSVKYKAVDVECGYVHSLIVALNGSVYICGGVGVEGENDGQQQQQTQETLNENGEVPQNISQDNNDGRPRLIPNLIVWKPLPEPKDEPVVKKERWQKLGKYEVKGRSKMN